MVKLIDEISQVKYLNEEKVTFLTKLRKESEQYEETVHERPQYIPRLRYEHLPDHTMTGIIHQAVHEIEEKNKKIPDYERDLRSNLDVVRIADDQSILISTLHCQILKRYQ